MLNPHDKTIKYDLRSDWPRGGRRTKDETRAALVPRKYFGAVLSRDKLAVHCVTTSSAAEAAGAIGPRH
jgi:hypothetical protein